MTDDRDDTERAAIERAAIRARFVAARAKIASVPPADWSRRRDDEVRIVRQAAADRRRTAA